MISPQSAASNSCRWMKSGEPAWRWVRIWYVVIVTGRPAGWAEAFARLLPVRAVVADGSKVARAEVRVTGATTAVREVVAYLDQDRPLFVDHNAMMKATAELRVLKAVEAAVGPLQTY